jgi:hypothetical protein
MKNFTLACVMKSGRTYNEKWVYRLCEDAKKYCSSGYDFVCLSDREIDGIKTIPLIHDWSTYWCKIELFRKGLFTNPVLYIDLDTLICGDVSKLMSVEHIFTMAHEWGRSGDPNSFQSSFMAWNGDFSFIYNLFKKDPNFYMKAYEKSCYVNGSKGRVFRNIGDQGFIPVALKNFGFKIKAFRDYFSEHIVSGQKYIGKDPEIRKNCIALTYHGARKYSIAPD